MSADRLDAEQLLPDAGDGLLGFVGRCDAIDAQLWSGRARSAAAFAPGSVAAVDLKLIHWSLRAGKPYQLSLRPDVVKISPVTVAG